MSLNFWLTQSQIQENIFQVKKLFLKCDRRPDLASFKNTLSGLPADSEAEYAAVAH